MQQRKPTTLLAELTHRCPLHCPYCSNPLELTRSNAEISTEDWKRVFSEARELGVLQLGLSGGEPLVRRDLEELLANAQYYGWAVTNRASLMPTREQIERSEEIADRAVEKYKGKMQIVYVLPDYYSEFPKPCYGGWGNYYIVVAPDGRAMPCHAASQITSLTFDNVRDKSLGWIWEESHAFRAFRGDEWMKEPCRSCPRKHIDFGGCRCQAFALTGDAANTDPVCTLTPDRALVDRALAEAGVEA